MKFRPTSLAEFTPACRAIVGAWESRDGRGEAIALLERQAYELISHMIDDELLDLWEPRILLLDRRGSSGRLNHFAQGLRVIFAESPGLLDAKKRELIGLRLAHAYNHFVPLPFLAGFLGPVSRRPGKGVEPGFEAWIAYHLSHVEDDHDYRGEHPEPVTALSETIKRSEFTILERLAPVVVDEKKKKKKIMTRIKAKSVKPAD